VFALLGVSGAGKSSTLNMVLGEEDITGGSATLNGADVSDSLYRQADKMNGLIGYCPQDNPLQDNMTVK
jgi:ATP-binding cassette subfamily A (ABC1) protein 3